MPNFDALARSRVVSAEGWGRFTDTAPWLSFDPEWEVQVIPPTTFAMMRFRVRHGSASVSVYMDGHNALGCFTYDDGQPAPYWEVYPHDDDVWRCGLDEGAALVEAIRESIAQQLAEADE